MFSKDHIGHLTVSQLFRYMLRISTNAELHTRNLKRFIMLILGQVRLGKGQESLGRLVPRRDNSPLKDQKKNIPSLWVQYQWYRFSYFCGFRLLWDGDYLHLRMSLPTIALEFSLIHSRYVQIQKLLDVISNTLQVNIETT